MTYDFNAKTKLADNKDGETTLAEELAVFIGTETEGKTLKLYGWMKDLQVGNPLQLDESDKRDLYNLIDTSKRIPIFIKGQFLDVLK